MGNGNDCADRSCYPTRVTQCVLHDTGEMDWDCACSPMEIHVWFHGVMSKIERNDPRLVSFEDRAKDL
jgi:hypothetical protein